ncbi:MAG: spore coat associated protein CotJA [Ruminococcaceae bacterium]|nr:spore coat associated protein CotJA [Oscillospiraceae bacterium]
MGEDRFSDIKLRNLPLTMAYVPFQQIEGVYNCEEALKSGTLFPNLDKPFLGRKV